MLRNPLDIAPTTTPGVRLASLMGPPAQPPVEKDVQGTQDGRCRPGASASAATAAALHG